MLQVQNPHAGSIVMQDSFCAACRINSSCAGLISSAASRWGLGYSKAQLSLPIFRDGHCTIEESGFAMHPACAEKSRQKMGPQLANSGASGVLANHRKLLELWHTEIAPKWRNWQTHGTQKPKHELPSAVTRSRYRLRPYWTAPQDNPRHQRLATLLATIAPCKRVSSRTSKCRPWFRGADCAHCRWDGWSA